MPLPRTLNRLLWFTTHKIGFWVFHLGWSYRCSSRHNLPDVGSALIVSNHQSFIDPLLVGLIARRPLTFLARKNLFKNRIFGALLHEYGAFPIDRNWISALLAPLRGLRHLRHDHAGDGPPRREG